MNQNQRFSDFQLEPVFRIPNTNQIIVPHYINPHQWVALGNVMWTTKELIASNAVPEIKCLWSRTWTESHIFQGTQRTLEKNELATLIKARA